MRTLKAKPDCLRAVATGRAVGVDRKANTIRGFVVAQEGPFKSEGRGEFDVPALKQLVKLGNAKPKGLRSRFTHPEMSSDGLGKHLGRAFDLSLSTATDERTGKSVAAVRADLVIDKTAMESPPGGGGKPYGMYVMDLAESDAGAISSSIVVRADENFRLNKDGTLQTDEQGNPLPPLWWPTELLASDIVDTGDAVDSLLTPEFLSQALGIDSPELKKLLRFDNLVRFSSQALDSFFAGQSEEVVRARVTGFLNRYLSRRYGSPLPGDVDDEPVAKPKLEAMKARLNKLSLTM